MTSVFSQIKGVGAYLPGAPVSNEAIAAKHQIDTNDAWIQSRTGITQRYIADENIYTSDLAANAGKQALAQAGLAADALDLIIVATSSPDRTFPATAVRVQALLGASRAAAFDVQAVCAGFVYALATADGLLKSLNKQTALVIGAETFSRLVDWQDRSSCVLFGDGAGAVVLQRGAQPGLLTAQLASDGGLQPILQASGGVSLSQTTGYTQMDGGEVFKHAVQKMSQIAKATLEAQQVTIDQVDWLIPHQANKRILDSVAKRLKIAPEKTIMTVQQHANTSAASIPLAMATGIADGRIQPGHTLLLVGLGAGLSWGSVLIKY